jgi:hypothetical protein
VCVCIDLYGLSNLSLHFSSLFSLSLFFFFFGGGGGVGGLGASFSRYADWGIHYFRKMSTEEKRNLGTALTRLAPEDLSRALEIVAETNPSFQASAQEVDLDMDAQVIIIYLFIFVVGLSFIALVAQICDRSLSLLSFCLFSSAE